MCNLSYGIYDRGTRDGVIKGMRIGKAEGKIDALIDMVRDGLLSGDAAAKRAREKYGIPEDRFVKLLDAYHPDN